MANRPVLLRSAILIKGKKEIPVLVLAKGQLSGDDIRDMGFLIHQSKDEEVEHIFLKHPTNVMALRMLKAVCEARGIDLHLKLETADGKDIRARLYARQVHFHSKSYARCFDPIQSAIQVDVAVDKMIVALTAKNHHLLAGAAVLTVIEDYDPEEMKDKIRKDPKKGEVWAYVRRTNKAEKDLTGFDFRIALCKEIWARLDMSKKRYVLDHELMHCGKNEKTGNWELWAHSVQFFDEEVRRYGGKIPEIDLLVDRVTATHNEAKRMHTKKKDRST